MDFFTPTTIRLYSQKFITLRTQFNISLLSGYKPKSCAHSKNQTWVERMHNCDVTRSWFACPWSMMGSEYHAAVHVWDCMWSIPLPHSSSGESWAWRKNSKTTSRRMLWWLQTCGPCLHVVAWWPCLSSGSWGPQKRHVAPSSKRGGPATWASSGDSHKPRPEDGITFNQSAFFMKQLELEHSTLLSTYLFQRWVSFLSIMKADRNSINAEHTCNEIKVCFNGNTIHYYWYTWHCLESTAFHIKYFALNNHFGYSVWDDWCHKLCLSVV